MPVLVAARDLTPFVTALGVMILLLMATLVALLWFRSRILARGGSEADAAAGLLQNLRAMRDRGEITTEEYDRTRRAMAARAAERAKARHGAEAGPAGVAGAPAASAAPAAQRADEIRAKPGFDLTGRPLPKPGSDAKSGETG